MVQNALMEEDEVARLPEAIALAERWRQAGVVLRARSPELFASFSALLGSWVVSQQDAEEEKIDLVYEVT